MSEDVRFKESATIAPGSEVVTAATEFGTLGLSVCYDLRFAELYAALVKKGAQIITVPSAFTLMTGKDHWYALLRARAIETQCYVIAPAQSGKHDDRGLRHSYGHSIVIDPWGQVIGAASDGPGLALAEIDLERVARVRQADSGRRPPSALSRRDRRPTTRRRNPSTRPKCSSPSGPIRTRSRGAGRSRRRTISAGSLAPEQRLDRSTAITRWCEDTTGCAADRRGSLDQIASGSGSPGAASRQARSSSSAAAGGGERSRAIARRCVPR